MIKFTFWYSTGDCAEGKIIWVTACSTGVSIRCLYTTGLHTLMAIHSLYWYTYRPIILVILSSGGSWSSVEILTETRDLWVRSLFYVDIGLTWSQYYCSGEFKYLGGGYGFCSIGALSYVWTQVLLKFNFYKYFSLWAN